VASVYTKLFGFAVIGQNQTVQLLHVPIENTYVLRDLVVHNSASTPATVYIYWQYPDANIFLLRIPALAAQSTVHQELRQVLPPDSLLLAFSSELNATVTATGYVLSSPA
jgi:hypothetical protein